MLNIAHYQRNVNQNYTEESPMVRMAIIKKSTINAGEDVEKGNPLALTVGKFISLFILQLFIECPLGHKYCVTVSHVLPLPYLFTHFLINSLFNKFFQQLFIRICAIPDTRLTTDERLKALEREETRLSSRMGKPQGKQKILGFMES